MFSMKEILYHDKKTRKEDAWTNGRKWKRSGIGGGEMLKKVYKELVLIREELQVIRTNLEFFRKQNKSVPNATQPSSKEPYNIPSYYCTHSTR